MMECLKRFADGYREISSHAREDDDVYENVKQEVDDVLRWKKLENETRLKIIEIKDYFEACLPENSMENDEAVIRKAKELGMVMGEYNMKINKTDASVNLDPERIDARIARSKERIKMIEVHGLHLGFACIVLLTGVGAVTGWQIGYGAKAVKIVLGGAAGLGCGILMFLISYHSILALEKRHLSRWEELNKTAKDFPQMVADIPQKRTITRKIANSLTYGVEISIKNAAQEIVDECDKFLQIKVVPGLIK